MSLRVFRARAASLLALLAMGLQASWPLLALANPGPQSMLLVPLCTVDGATHYIEIPVGGDRPRKNGTPGHSGHCALCVTASERAGAGPPLAVAAVVLEPVPAERPAGDAGTQVVSASHPPAQPRAPPASL